jgi:ABC-type methionine transport system ATPase subunit
MMMAGVSIWQRKRKAMDLLEAVDLCEVASRRPEQLSGGQQQRVAIAVAIANRPLILLADEPTGSLDRESARQVMELLVDLRQRYGLTILMVTHDMEVAAYADRVLTLRDGALGEDLSDETDVGPSIDAEGRIQLPKAVWSQLSEAHRLAVEIRPEGVLLRAEEEDSENTDALLEDMLPQDVPPERRRSLFLRVLGRNRESEGRV